MSLITGNIEQDFFEQNSQLTVKTEMKDLIKKENKKTASKIMWSIFLIEDPKSIYYKMPRDERIAEVQREFYPIDVEEHKYLLDAYARLTMSKEQIMFKVHMDTMDRLTAYLKELNLDEDKEFNKIVRVMEKLPKMWEGLEKIRTKMIEAENVTAMQGTGRESAREKRRK